MWIWKYIFLFYSKISDQVIVILPFDCSINNGFLTYLSFFSAVLLCFFFSSVSSLFPDLLWSRRLAPASPRWSSTRPSPDRSWARPPRQVQERFLSPRPFWWNKTKTSIINKKKIWKTPFERNIFLSYFSKCTIICHINTNSYSIIKVLKLIYKLLVIIISTKNEDWMKSKLIACLV